MYGFLKSHQPGAEQFAHTLHWPPSLPYGRNLHGSWTATPSTTTSIPLSQWLQTSRQNYVRVPAQVDRLLLGGACAEVDAVIEPNRNERVTWGLPADRILEIQNNSAASSIRRVSSNFVAPALGTLNSASGGVAGSSINHSFSIVHPISRAGTPRVRSFDKNFVSHFAKSRRFRYDAFAGRMKV